MTRSEIGLFSRVLALTGLSSELIQRIDVDWLIRRHSTRWRSVGREFATTTK
jgi:hypothetical protein